MTVSRETKKPTLEEQIAAAERLLAYVGDEYDDQDRETLRWLQATLRWMSKNRQTLDLAAEIMRDDAMRVLTDAFPDARVVRARKIEPTDAS